VPAEPPTGLARIVRRFSPLTPLRGADGWAIRATPEGGVRTVDGMPVTEQALSDAMKTSPKAGAVWGSVWLVYIVLYVTTLLFGWDRRREDNTRALHGWTGGMTDQGRQLAVALMFTSLACVLVVGEPGTATVVFLAPVVATILPGDKARWAILVVVAAVVAAELLADHSAVSKPDAGDVLSEAFATLMAGAITLGVRRMRVVMWELHAAKADVERLATAQERVRIARDLHDVLGHSLTVISMRSQLAAKLVDRGDMDKAGEEIRAVEALSRSAMQDVREAVAGYRVRPFAAELAAAEATLEGAGLQVEIQRSGEELPEAGEEALAFVMREGVTNVLRHSSAGRCAISVRHTPSAVIVQLADDGRGIGRPMHEIGNVASGTGGDVADDGCNGLRGLAERLAAVGGRLSAGDDPAGGFVLRAEVAR
jgi:two-component system sensor histidine kinase DesK